MRQAGDVLLGGASGAGRLLLNTKASQEAACSRAPAAIVPGPEPESRDAGVSRFAEIGSHLAVAPVTDAAGVHVSGPGSSEFTKNGSHLAGADAAEGRAGQLDGLGSSGNAGIGSHLEMTPVTDAVGAHVGGSGSSEFTRNGSHLAEADAAEGHAGQVDGPGSSGNAENGSHPAAADFSNEPGAVMWRRPPSRRTESGLLSYGMASPDSSVQKTALWRTRAHLSAGAARGGGSSAGRHVERMTGVSGNRWRIVVAQVRRKSMMARWLQSRCRQCVPRMCRDCEKCLSCREIAIPAATCREQ